jgi:hypothetical protein
LAVIRYNKIDSLLIKIKRETMKINNFFGKVRKKLADDNKPLRYVWYAIGEILFYVTHLRDVPDLNTKNEFLPAGKGRDQGVGIATRKIIPFHPHLIALAKKLRNKMTIGEIAL